MTSTSNSPSSQATPAASDGTALRKGAVMGAVGALGAAAVIGGAIFVAFGTHNGDVEQTNRMGAPTTIIGDASTRALAPAPVAPAPLVAQPNPSYQTQNAPQAGGSYPAVEQPAHSRVAPPVAGKAGVVTAVREVTVKGEANGVGAVAGGALGGLLGHQVGGGNGRTAMTVIGAVGGGLAGHEVQKRMNGTKVYNVTVQFDDGTTRTLTENTARGWRNGDRVRVNKGVIVAENA